MSVKGDIIRLHALEREGYGASDEAKPALREQYRELRASILARLPEGSKVCHGTSYPCRGGTIQIAGIVENGVFKGSTGDCHRCAGKGYQTREDQARNWGYDTFYRRISI